MELWKGDDDNYVKFYESDLWVDEFQKDFNLKFTDAELCNCKPGLPIEIRFISRNQYKMENEVAVACVTSLARMSECFASQQAVQLFTPEGTKLGRLHVK